MFMKFQQVAKAILAVTMILVMGGVASAAPKLISLDNTGARLFSEGADLKVETVTSWKMKSVYPSGSK
jgi:hypothetical protein